MRAAKATTAEIFGEAVMQKVFIFVLLTLALLGGVATVTTLTAAPAHAGWETGNC
jgi:hypothetical protein